MFLSTLYTKLMENESSGEKSAVYVKANTHEIKALIHFEHTPPYKSLHVADEDLPNIRKSA